MTINISDSKISEALNQLGVKTENLGSSTGSNWFASGEELISKSPVDGAIIGKGAVIGAGAVVKENTVVEPNSLVVGVPARKVKVLSGSYETNVKWARKYVDLARLHKDRFEKGA